MEKHCDKLQYAHLLRAHLYTLGLDMCCVIVVVTGNSAVDNFRGSSLHSCYSALNRLKFA
jgi:hypothetical protein